MSEEDAFSRVSRQNLRSSEKLLAFLEQTEVRHRIKHHKKASSVNGVLGGERSKQANSVVLSAIEQEEVREKERMRLWNNSIMSKCTAQLCEEFEIQRLRSIERIYEIVDACRTPRNDYSFFPNEVDAQLIAPLPSKFTEDKDVDERDSGDEQKMITGLPTLMQKQRPALETLKQESLTPSLIFNKGQGAPRKETSALQGVKFPHLVKDSKPAWRGGGRSKDSEDKQRERRAKQDKRKEGVFKGTFLTGDDALMERAIASVGIVSTTEKESPSVKTNTTLLHLIAGAEKDAKSRVTDPPQTSPVLSPTLFQKKTTQTKVNIVLPTTASPMLSSNIIDDLLSKARLDAESIAREQLSKLSLMRRDAEDEAIERNDILAQVSKNLVISNTVAQEVLSRESEEKVLERDDGSEMEQDDEAMKVKPSKRASNKLHPDMALFWGPSKLGEVEKPREVVETSEERAGRLGKKRIQRRQEKSVERFIKAGMQARGEYNLFDTQKRRVHKISTGGIFWGGDDVHPTDHDALLDESNEDEVVVDKVSKWEEFNNEMNEKELAVTSTSPSALAVALGWTSAKERVTKVDARMKIALNKDISILRDKDISISTESNKSLFKMQIIQEEVELSVTFYCFNRGYGIQMLAQSPGAIPLFVRLHSTEVSLLLGKKPEWMRPDELWRCSFAERRWKQLFSPLATRLRVTHGTISFNRNIFKRVMRIHPLLFAISGAVMNVQCPDTWVITAEEVDLENDIESSTWSVILTFFNYQDNVSQHIPLKEDDINKLLGDEVVHVPELLILEGGIHQMLAGITSKVHCAILEAGWELLLHGQEPTKPLLSDIKRMKASIEIQRVYRGYQGRQMVKIEKRLVKWNCAAIIIQKHVRGHNVRKARKKDKLKRSGVFVILKMLLRRKRRKTAKKEAERQADFVETVVIDGTRIKIHAGLRYGPTNGDGSPSLENQITLDSYIVPSLVLDGYDPESKMRCALTITPAQVFAEVGRIKEFYVEDMRKSLVQHVFTRLSLFISRPKKIMLLKYIPTKSNNTSFRPTTVIPTLELNKK